MKLMDPDVRQSGQAAQMIADDFLEFGGNGTMYNKPDALAMMKRHAPRVSALEKFNARELSSGVALVTYRLRRPGTGGAPDHVSVRSSIWVQQHGKWQVTFHQATIIGLEGI
jgi:hypothetical protein